jgi:hypothetical protein
MHASLLLGCLGEATVVIGVGTGRMRKLSARAVPPVGLSSLGQEIRLFTEAKTTGSYLANLFLFFFEQMLFLLFGMVPDV